MKRLMLPWAVLAMAITQSGCVVVGGYSSGRGAFIWPGGLGLVVVLVLLYMVFGRRR